MTMPHLRQGAEMEAAAYYSVRSLAIPLSEEAGF